MYRKSLPISLKSMSKLYVIKSKPFEKMASKHLLAILTLTCLFLASCNSGYQKENGEWAWVSYDEAAGKRVAKIDPVDDSSFQVIKGYKEYAKDKNSVFYIGRIIEDADPNTFSVLNKKGYSIDQKNVFLTWEKVIFADPQSFQLIEAPYSKDADHVFCGTIPLSLPKKEVEEFKVENDDELMSGSISSISLSHFIKQNPSYKWLDTLGVHGVIVGEWATGKTKNRKFRGFKEIKN